MGVFAASLAEARVVRRLRAADRESEERAQRFASESVLIPNDQRHARPACPTRARTEERHRHRIVTTKLALSMPVTGVADPIGSAPCHRTTAPIPLPAATGWALKPLTVLCQRAASLLVPVSMQTCCTPPYG